MASFRRNNSAAFVILCWLISFLTGVSALGINYGQLGDNLLPPRQVVKLLSSNNITKTRIYDTNPQILTAFSNSGIELIVTVENEVLDKLTNSEAALQWVTTHVRPYVPATKITGISVGNEIDATDLLASLVPAMSCIQVALSKLGLDSHIKVSTPFSYSVMEESYPPSAGSFRSDLSNVMSQLLRFLSRTKAPFWVNAYPYFAYKDNSKGIPLDYVLFTSSAGMTDPCSHLHYDNMLYAQVDAVAYAISKLGFDDIEVKVGETGWPSKGDAHEVGASLENSAMYNGNLLKRQMRNESTPLRKGLDVYVFALFTENKKPGPTSERNFGLFHPDGTVAYNVGLSGLSSSKTPTSATYSSPPPPPVVSKASTSATNSTNASSSSSPPRLPALTYSSGAKTTIMGSLFWSFLVLVIGLLIC